MQLVVVMAVRKAVSAATITFTATSMILPFFIIINYPLSARLCRFALQRIIHYSESSPPLLLVKVFEVISLLTPSLMAIAFTVVVAFRLNASL